jgi:hypothetical protein
MYNLLLNRQNCCGAYKLLPYVTPQAYASSLTPLLTFLIHTSPRTSTICHVKVAGRDAEDNRLKTKLHLRVPANDIDAVTLLHAVHIYQRLQCKTSPVECRQTPLLEENKAREAVTRQQRKD